MKKFFLSLAVFVMALCANAQTNQYFWYQGNLMMGNPIAQIDSVTFGEGEPADTLHILLPRTIIKEVHDTVYITIHDTVCPEAIPEGALAGEFSVSETKKVRFSKGNLQYNVHNDTWLFANNQYDYIGKDNVANPQIIQREQPTPYSNFYWQGISIGNVVDLFAWSSDKDLSRKWGIESQADENNKFNGDFVEWGVNINDSWRTMSSEEWEYVISKRPNSENLIAIGSVNGTNGCILLPDNWQLPKNMTFNPAIADQRDSIYYSTINNYSIEEWKNMEKNGAVFLPASGDRSLPHNYVNWINITGAYWSSSKINSNFASYFWITSNSLQTTYSNYYIGRSVRLVQDVE